MQMLVVFVKVPLREHCSPLQNERQALDIVFIRQKYPVSVNRVCEERS